MNSNHNFDVNTKKRFNASLKKMYFFFIKCFFSLKNATFSLFPKIRKQSQWQSQLQ